MSDVKTDYPDRYYASYDKTASQPTAVTGWYDTWDMSSVSNVPAASDMIVVTESEWNDISFRVSIGKGVKDGVIVDYTSEVTVPIKTQAANELTWISSEASLASAMGETFTDAMKAYVKAIQAIANGTDTASASLPDRPTDIMS